MLLRLGTRVRECQERAAHWAQRAQAASNENTRAECLSAERSWAELAKSYEFVERLELFLSETGRRKLARTETTTRPEPGPSAHQNSILAGLPELRAKLQPKFEPVTLEPGRVLHHRGLPVDHVYFPLSGIVSVVAGRPNSRLEVAIVGQDGMTGILALFGASASPFQYTVQVSGQALRIALPDLKQTFDSEVVLRHRVLIYARKFTVQMAESAAATGACTVEQRVARWLVLYREHVGRDEVPVTHEALAAMLAVRRPSVTLALQKLERAKLVKNARGRIAVLDRAGLVDIADAAGELYQSA